MAVEKVKERAEESIERASREQQKPTGKNTRERTKTTEKCKYVKGAQHSELCQTNACQHCCMTQSLAV